MPRSHCSSSITRTVFNKKILVSNDDDVFLQKMITNNRPSELTQVFRTTVASSIASVRFLTLRAAALLMTFFTCQSSAFMTICTISIMNFTQHHCAKSKTIMVRAESYIAKRSVGRLLLNFQSPCRVKSQWRHELIWAYSTLR